MITHQLSVHDNARLVGAIFSDKGWNPNTKRLCGIDPDVKSQWDDVDYRIEHRAELMSQYFNADGVDCVGFKHHLSGDHDVIRDVLNDSSIRKIILTRTNLLACYSSHKIAVLHRSLGLGAKKPATTKFDAKEFNAFMFRRRKAYLRWNMLIERQKDTCFTITYNEARQDGGIAKVMDFLDLPYQSLPQPTKKRNSDDVLSRFSNPDAAAAYLRLKGLEDWVREDPETA